MCLLVINKKPRVLMLSQYNCYSVALAGCEVAVCEAQCVVGSVVRPVEPSLPPTYTHCGHTAGLSGQPLQPHHFPSLGGMTEAGSWERRWKRMAAFHWLLPRCGLSDCQVGMRCTHTRWMETQGVFLYLKKNLS